MTKTSYTIESLLRGLRVLALFNRETPALSLSQIKDAVGLNKSTAYRILYTLEEAGYLERDPQTRLYNPGLKVLQLGFTAISGLEIRQVARPFLRQLAEEMGHTASLGVLDGMEVVYIDRVRYRRPVTVGDSVRLEGWVVRLRKKIGVLKGIARVNGHVVCEGQMTFALGDR